MRTGGLTRPISKPRRARSCCCSARRARGEGLGKTTGWIHRTALKNRGVRMIAGVTYRRIDDAGLHVSIGGKDEVLAVDNVIPVTGQEPQRELQAALVEAGMRVHLIGGADVAAELDAKRAIKQGIEVGQHREGGIRPCTARRPAPRLPAAPASPAAVRHPAHRPRRPGRAGDAEPPDKANAMNLQMWRDLRAAMQWVDRTPAVRVAVLHGAGEYQLLRRHRPADDDGHPAHGEGLPARHARARTRCNLILDLRTRSPAWSAAARCSPPSTAPAWAAAWT